jgi:hypothetical protein
VNATASADVALIDPARLALNDVEAMRIEEFEIDGLPVVIVDDVYLDPQYVRRLALSLHYHHAGGQYPGEMAFVSIYPRAVAGLVDRLYGPHVGLPLTLNKLYRSTTFAIVTRRPDDLTAGQCQPHFDDFCAHAGVVYLNPDAACSGGTSFWRHRSTHLASGVQPEIARAVLSLGAQAPSPQRYLTESTEYWELLHLVPMRFNRLVVYDSRLFHTPHYDERRFGTTLPRRRLTQNLYFDFDAGPVGEEPFEDGEIPDI